MGVTWSALFRVGFTLGRKYRRTWRWAERASAKLMARPGRGAKLEYLMTPITSVAVFLPSRPSPDAPARRQTCGNGFPPNSLRVGYRASPGAAEPIQWMHVECMSQARWRTVPGMLVGLTGLTPRDRVRSPRPCDPPPYPTTLRWQPAPSTAGRADRSDAARLRLLSDTLGKPCMI